MWTHRMGMSRWTHTTMPHSFRLNHGRSVYIFCVLKLTQGIHMDAISQYLYLSTSADSSKTRIQLYHILLYYAKLSQVNNHLMHKIYRRVFAYHLNMASIPLHIHIHAEGVKMLVCYVIPGGWGVECFLHNQLFRPCFP